METIPAARAPRFYDDIEQSGRRLALLRAERDKARTMQIWAELTAEIEIEMGGGLRRDISRDVRPEAA